MLKTVPHSKVRQQHPQGFTLVEMLVAVGLLLLLMSILAQVFAIASTAMRTTRGIANNDQRSRILYTVLGNDLSKISYQPLSNEVKNGIHTCVPISLGSVDPKQAGYIYISENDPNDDTDDVLAITCDATSNKKDKTPFYGKSIGLGDEDDLSQPDHDDGEYGNQSTFSKKAEITYFLRKGVLYRQVFLVREPSNPTTGSFDLKATPVDNSSNLLLDSTFYPATKHFYNDFSLSGYFDIGATPTQIVLNGTLSNVSTDTGHPLGIAKYRTGFDRRDVAPNKMLPLEYWNDSGNERFIGRLTLRELSDNNCGYAKSSTNTFRTVELNAAHDQNIFNNRGILSGFDTVPGTDKRSGADILLTNVLSFDVKVWDSVLGTFANMGHSDSTTDITLEKGQFHKDNKLNTNYGPHTVDTTLNNVYDTWHNKMEVGQPDVLGTGLPPFRVRHATNDTNKTRLNDYPYYRGNWQPSTNYLIGDIVKPTTPIDTDFAFIAINNGVSDATEPSLFTPPITLSSNVIDNTVTWSAILNEKPLKGLKITIRFQDSYTGQVRQMAIVHSFAEN